MNNKKAFEKLIKEAIRLCWDYEKVSPYLFQRRLATDFATAVMIVTRLKKENYLTGGDYFDEDGEENALFEVNKNKILSQFSKKPN